MFHLKFRWFYFMFYLKGVAICTLSSTACNSLAGVRVFGRRKQNLRVLRSWEGDHIWVRFAPKLHHVLIKSIRMLGTLSLSINEVEDITKESIRSNSRSLQQCMAAILFPQSSRPYWQEERRHDLIDRFELVDDDSTFYKDICRHNEWNSTLLKM